MKIRQLLKHQTRLLLPVLALFTLLCYRGDLDQAYAASTTLALADTPLFLQQNVEPNVMFLIDDSGSMAAETLSPYLDNGSAFDVIFNYSSQGITQKYAGYNYIYSPDWNKLYYDPNITYQPWPSTNTRTFSNVAPTAAPVDASNLSSPTVDLTQNGVAVYYTLNAGKDPNLSASYTLHTVTNMQNFANWYTYYRSRINMAKSGVANAINNLSGMRVGLTDIYNATASTLLVPVKSITNDAQGNGLTQKYTLLNTLYSLTPLYDTPLRTALDGIGKYFKTTGANAPITAACQQNFTILMTDGYWNDSFSGVGNADGDQGKPYADEYDNTLADVAMYYYKNNLRPDLTAGQVPLSPSNHETNPNPHMDTFTIGLGVQGTLDSSVDPYASNPAWPQPTANANTTVDDLWHAAVNGRGQFFSATNAASLSKTLNNYLGNVAGRTASAAAVSLDSTSISSTTNLFQARFDSAFWTGDLLSYGINTTTGNINATPIWSAQSKLDTRAQGSGWDTNRFIATWNPSSAQGAPFRWSQLAPSQQSALNGTDTLGADRLNYLRGDASKEGNPFRIRQHVLGDIINSQPIYVGKPPFNYLYQNYTTFKNTQSTRPEMLYVGSNDGMLHAFDANSGEERFAFVPNGVYGNLAGRTSTNLIHKYLVDGTPTVGDVTFSDNSWHTLLVGGLNNGGNSVYALDVTDPASMSNETTLASKVKWEFTSPSLGQSFSRPIIVPVANNSQGTSWKWIVLFGSGYNNANGKPYLFALDAQTGAATTIDLCGSGTKTSTACDLTKPNGLGTPTAISSTGGNLVDTVYVGDLQGNMWKVDLSSLNTANWGSAYTANGKTVPLFKAQDSLGTPQPITTAPEVTIHPLYPGKTGQMVYFGTGKYLESGDIGDTSQQSIYGIWDNGAALGSFNRNTSPTTPNLQAQSLLTVSQNGQLLRLSSSNTINWSTQKGWYLDLPVAGERSFTNIQLVAGRLIFTTFIPNTAPCGLGGTSWLLVLNYASGSSFNNPEIDINNDGILNSNDSVANPNPGFNPNPSGMSLGESVASSPTVVGAGKTAANGVGELKYISKSDGSVQTVKERGGGAYTSRPIAWRELF